MADPKKSSTTKGPETPPTGSQQPPEGPPPSDGKKKAKSRLTPEKPPAKPPEGAPSDDAPSNSDVIAKVQAGDPSAVRLEDVPGDTPMPNETLVAIEEKPANYSQADVARAYLFALRRRATLIREIAAMDDHMAQLRGIHFSQYGTRLVNFGQATVKIDGVDDNGGSISVDGTENPGLLSIEEMKAHEPTEVGVIAQTTRMGMGDTTSVVDG